MELWELGGWRDPVLLVTRSAPTHTQTHLSQYRGSEQKSQDQACLVSHSGIMGMP